MNFVEHDNYAYICSCKYSDKNSFFLYITINATIEKGFATVAYGDSHRALELPNDNILVHTYIDKTYEENSVLMFIFDSTFTTTIVNNVDIRYSSLIL